MSIIRFYSLRQSFRGNAAKCALPDLKCHDKGDIWLKRSGRKYKDYSATIGFTRRSWDDLRGQVKDAKRFLKTRGAELRKLTRGIALDQACIDFPVNSRHSDKVAVQQDFLDHELLALCAKHGLGINLANYFRDWMKVIGLVTSPARTASRFRAQPRPGRSLRRPGRRTIA